MAVHENKDLMIGGIPVKFPYKPYPSQLSMMSKIIKGLQNGKHCLLESPTGSGKTLALLCSALAWQEDAKKKIEAELSRYCNDDANSPNCSVDSEQDFETCCNSKKGRKTLTIWFGTRTHKQIAQITHELGRTAYKNVNMTILSSREYSCIHPVNEKSKNKNDGCRDLLKGRHPDLPNTHCSFYTNVHRIKTHASLYSCGLTSAWDLEDFVKLGRRVRACPYYASRELMSSAEIIFCPYNYLVDPRIRSQMNINLNGQVVILDEAHNIEDCSRDAASNTLNEMDLVNIVADLDYLIAEKVKENEHKPLHLLCTKIGQWLQARAATLAETSYETWSQTWSGHEFLSCLAEWGITADTLPTLHKCFVEASSADENESADEKESPKMLHSASQALLGGLFQVLSYLLLSNKKYVQDFRIAIIRRAEYGIPPAKRTKDGWIALNKRATRYFSVNLHFWCLNPAVAFSQFESAHCVILTSGTLSPMLSFSSELGLSFPIQLEASHVISDRQVWVGAIGAGPNGHQLQATYQNTNALDFQDELGKLVLSVCSVVPHGVLCFFSSYKMLEKLCERWENTGLWEELSQKKKIFSEPHGRNKSNFEEVMQSFYEFTSSSNDRTGALLLAVCRGKISEGIDFSDNNARAVITVGIPFPNFKDQQVELKRKYNDEHSRSRGLLSGADWYETQAFRALNQALGRCIRHKNDWGALIIVDDRFCKNPKRYCKGLSKWVRSKVKTFSSFQSANDSLASFCHNREFARDVTMEVVNVCEIDKNGLEQSAAVDVSTSSVSHSEIYVEKDNLSSSNLQNSSNSNLKTDFYQYTGRLRNKSISSQKKANIKETPNFFQPGPASRPPLPWTPAADNQSVANDDVILIPSTPEKETKVIIIPESPDDFDFKSDFKSNSSKRKEVISPTPRSISHRLAKKCKQSLNFSINDCLKPPESKPIVTQDDSQELFAPRTRRKRSLKASRKEERKSGNCSKIDECKTNDDITRFQCGVCESVLTTSVVTSDLLSNSFYYIISTFPGVKNFYCLSAEHKNDFLVKTLSSNDNRVVLDTAWCATEQLAYQFYTCRSCPNVVGFCIVNSTKFTDLYLISTQIAVL